MTATTIWWALLVAGVLVEVLSRIYPSRVSNLRAAASVVAERLVGRIVLIAFWLFVGIHLFARYTLPHH